MYIWIGVITVETYKFRRSYQAYEINVKFLIFTFC